MKSVGRKVSLEILADEASECVNQNLHCKEFIIGLYEHLTGTKVKEIDEKTFEVQDMVEEVDEDTPVLEFKEPQEVCPCCQSEKITNEDAPANGILHCDCLDCGRKWTEPDS